MTTDDSFERFRACAQAYGHAMHRWPADDQALHTRYADTAAGRHLLREAARLDELLDRDAPAPARPELLAAILRQSAPHAMMRTPPRHRRSWLTAAAVTLTLIVGFALGWQQQAADEPETALLLGAIGPLAMLP
ncbi:hypothetical protein [Plasticicumulans acidivorans]|uniref:Uncharacterized protein n=1 Tax=Plasticicumulans acidivorans TaxID=886464 RepID=A0A317MZV3_9GAMM|nr:hypothetical protein [Plasticicumulans acidivorans]PWV65523.1 hypothetical protein C7443_1016 [Plasticicumulans acidivorans]